MIALKDITQYTDQLAAQTEESERKFQVICDTMPQMARSLPFTVPSVKADSVHSSGQLLRQACMTGLAGDGTTSPG